MGRASTLLEARLPSRLTLAWRRLRAAFTAAL